MRYKGLFIVIMVLFCCVWGASSYAKNDNTAAPHHEKEAPSVDHGDDHGVDSHQGSFPVWYIVYWAGLLALTGLSAKYLIKGVVGGISSVEVSPQDTALVVKMVILGVCVYAIGQFPSLKQYHEPSLVGMVKFFLKTAAGISMMIYSFSGIEEHH